MSSRGGEAITTIPLRKATRDRLKQLGSKGETYDTILNKLIDQTLQARVQAPSPAPGAVEIPAVAKPGATRPPALVTFEPVEVTEEAVEDDEGR